MDAHIGWLAAKLGGAVTSAALLAQSVEPPPGTSLLFLPIIVAATLATVLDGALVHLERKRGMPRRRPWVRALAGLAAAIGGYHALMYALVFTGRLSVRELGPVWLRPMVPLLMLMLVALIVVVHLLVRERWARHTAELAEAKSRESLVRLRSALEQAEAGTV